MKAKDIVIGGKYNARVSGKFCVVRVDVIREYDPCFSRGISLRPARTQTQYDVTNLTTGRKLTFRSAAKFRSVSREESKSLEERYNTHLANIPSSFGESHV